MPLIVEFLEIKSVPAHNTGSRSTFPTFSEKCDHSHFSHQVQPTKSGPSFLLLVTQPREKAKNTDNHANSWFFFFVFLFFSFFVYIFSPSCFTPPSALRFLTMFVNMESAAFICKPGYKAHGEEEAILNFLITS